MRVRIENKDGFVRIAILFVLMTAVLVSAQAQDLSLVKNLNWRWKFSIGDKLEWANPAYDDEHWEEIWVAKSWEEQGFHGYDGYAWYRTSFKLPESSDKLNYYIQLGYIDDVDQVFINGKKIGQTGKFPPKYTTAFNARRLYIIPHKLLHASDVVHISVRVFDEGGEGGIVHGKVALMVDRSSINPDFDLQGDWKFKTGACSTLPDKSDYDSWEEIYVPGTWEDQGYKFYDGIACYVTEFDLNGQFADERVVLLLGKIDDLDMVYINGVLVGQSSFFTEETVQQRSDQYKVNRAYYIPPGILKDDGKNVLLVKVLDVMGEGGIWDGSIGLISQDNYIDYWRKKRNAIQD